jgi:hypothetical protein
LLFASKLGLRPISCGTGLQAYPGHIVGIGFFSTVSVGSMGEAKCTPDLIL